MAFSIKSQMNQLIRQAAIEISHHQKEIEQEWERFLKRLKQKNTFMDISSDEQIVFRQLIKLFWDQLPRICSNDSEAHFYPFQDEWKKQQAEPLHAHKSILLFTILEQLTHKIMNKNGKDDIQLHQSIQHFFSIFVQHLLSDSDRKLLNIEDFMNQVFQNSDNPFLWFAKISQENSGFKMERFITHKSLSIETSWIKMIHSLQGPSIDILTDAITRLLSQPSADEWDVFPFPEGDDWYLFCKKKSEQQKIKPFFSLFFKILKENEELHEILQVKNDWKDSLILFDEWIMLARNFQEAIEKVVSGFTKYLPFERAALFYYTKGETGEDIGIGVMGHKIDTKDIRNIRENLNNHPQITMNLYHIQPLFLPNAEQVLPKKFVLQYHLESLVIVPIYSAFNNQVLGAVFLDQGEGEKFSISNAMLSIITKFGQHAGEILAKYSPDKENIWPLSNKGKLTNREIEILRLIAEGKSIDEAAECLFLSPYTVRDYISIIKKKLNAQNRAQAIAEAIRHGII